MAHHDTDNGVQHSVPTLCEQALRALVEDVTRATGGAAFLHEDPTAYRAGVRDLAAALLGQLPKALAASEHRAA